MEIIEILKTVAPWASGGLGGAILTLGFNAWVKRKRAKIITVDVSTRAFSLPDVSPEKGLQPDALSISYKGEQYPNLLLYKAVLQNTGHGGVDKHRVVFAFPRETRVVDTFTAARPIKLPLSETKLQTDDAHEYHEGVPRLEKGDAVSFTFLIDCANPDEIRCLPRDIDNVDFRIEQSVNQVGLQHDLYQLMLLAAFFVMWGAVPFIGAFFKGLTVLLMIPSAGRLFKELLIWRQESSIMRQEINLGHGLDLVVHNATGGIILNPRPK